MLRQLIALLSFLVISTNLYAVVEPQLSLSLLTPAGLEADVDFWEQIFMKYDKDECVLHDKWDLRVVYAVKQLPNGSPRQRKKAMEAYREEIASGLRRLARMGGRPSDKLTNQIFDAIPQDIQKTAFYREASGDVRCQQGVASQLRASLQRSEKYMPMIKKILRQKGVPEDLAYLPHLESGFNVRAESKVGARGLWQLMPRTARAGMRVNRNQDQRLDPWVATDFAADMLADNFRAVKSWPLALTGYNYGINGIRRAVRKLSTSDYMIIREQHQSRSFGFAARNFYPSFLAVRNIGSKYAAGEIDLAALEGR